MSSARAMETRCFSPTLSFTPALADDGGKSLRQALDEIPRVRGPGRLQQFLVGRVRLREAQIVAHRAVEQKALLRDQADRAAQPRLRQIAQRHAVDRECRPGRIRRIA